MKERLITVSYLKLAAIGALVLAVLNLTVAQHFIKPSLVTNAVVSQLEFHEILRFGRGFPRSIAWHLGGEIILVNTANDVWLYAADTFETLAHFEDMNWGRFSTDGRWLIGTTDVGEAALWDMTTIGQYDYQTDSRTPVSARTIVGCWGQSIWSTLSC